MLGRLRRRNDRRAAPADDVWQLPPRFNFTRDVVEQLARDRDRRALTFVDNEGVVSRLTFADVAIASGRWAALLRARGLKPGDRVLVLVGKTPDWNEILLGALKAGLVAVPCSELLRGRDLAFRARHSGASLLVADPAATADVESMGRLLEHPLATLFLDEARELLPDFDTTVPTHDTGLRDPALLVYTSGTTNEPRGVVHTHAYTWTKRLQARHWLDAGPGDLVWCTTGTGWAKSVWNVLLGPWSQGAEIVLHQSHFDPAERFDLLERLGITVLCQSPTEYRLMAKLDSIESWNLSLLRHAVSTGEPLTAEPLEAFREALGVTIHDGYGQTENTVLAANLPGMIVRPGSMGKPTPGHDLDVIGEAGTPVAAGMEGTLALRGRPPSLFTGYWEDPEGTRAVYRGDWYLTGDRAVRDEAGFLWFRGRADDVITSAAYRIGPFEVESTLLEHPAVLESAAVGKPDRDRGQIVKAFVVLRHGFDASDALAEALQEHAKRITAPYAYPREIEFVAELPKSPSGKVRRIELRRREEALAEATSDLPVVVPLPVPERRDPVPLVVVEDPPPEPEVLPPAVAEEPLPEFVFEPVGELVEERASDSGAVDGVWESSEVVRAPADSPPDHEKQSDLAARLSAYGFGADERKDSEPESTADA